MKNIRIEQSFGLTINMGDFQSARIDMSIAADIGDEKDIKTAIPKLRKILIENFKKEAPAFDKVAFELLKED